LTTGEDTRLAYDRAVQLARDSEHRLSELLNVLLLGNSFLVVAFASIVAQNLPRVVPYVISSVGILLCALLFLGINSVSRLSRARMAEVRRLVRELERKEGLKYTVRYTEEALWFKVFIFSRVFDPYVIYTIWLPSLFFSMWVLLMVFAIH